MDANKLRKIKAIIVDVDGTLTDGSVYYDNLGNEIKKFNTRDAAGIFAAKQAGIEIIILTGRASEAVKRRMKDLKVDWVEQGVHDKHGRLMQIMKEQKWTAENMGYIGDDLNDLPAMELCGFVACPADSAIEVIEQADFVSTCNGGNGAVRDILRSVLIATGKWENAVRAVYFGKAGV